MSWREPTHGGFVMLWRRGLQLLTDSLVSGEIKPSDTTVLWQLAARQHNVAGTSRASVRALAKEAGGSATTVSHALRRLSRAGLVARVGHPQSRPAMYSINPFLVANGNEKQQAHAARYFAAAWADLPPPVPVTEAAVKARHALAKHLPQHLQQQAG